MSFSCTKEFQITVPAGTPNTLYLDVTTVARMVTLGWATAVQAVVWPPGFFHPNSVCAHRVYAQTRIGVFTDYARVWMTGGCTAHQVEIVIGAISGSWIFDKSDASPTNPVGTYTFNLGASSGPWGGSATVTVSTTP